MKKYITLALLSLTVGLFFSMIPFKSIILKQLGYCGVIINDNIYVNLGNNDFNCESTGERHTIVAYNYYELSDKDVKQAHIKYANGKNIVKGNSALYMTGNFNIEYVTIEPSWVRVYKREYEPNSY